MRLQKMNANYSPKIWKKQETILVKLPYIDFDAAASDHLRTMITTLLDKYTCKFIILDLSEVNLIDGSGLAAIVYVLNQCTAKGIKLVLSSLKENVLATIDERGIDSLMDIYGNVHEALDAAMHMVTLDNAANKTSKLMESVFGDPSEEEISSI